MAENIIGLLFEIGADPSKAESALKDFGTSIDKYIGAAQGTAAKTGAAFVAAGKDLLYLGGAAAGVATGALLLAERWAAAGSEIFEAREKTGLLADNLSGLHATAKVLGESTGTLDLTLVRLGRNIEAGLREPSSAAGKTLQSLFKDSQDLRELGMKPLDAQLALVTARINSLNSTSQQNIAYIALAGRGYNEVRSTLSELGSKGYDPLIARAKQLGQFFDDDAARRARQFTIELAHMKTEMSGLAMTIGQQLVPAMTQLVLLAEVKMQQSLGKNLVQAIRDAGAGAVWFMAALNPMITKTDEWKDEVDRLTLSIAGGKDETQAMTRQLVEFMAMVQAAAKGTGALGNETKTAKDETEGMVSALKRWGDLGRDFTIELNAGGSPALERYLKNLEKIAEVSRGGLTNSFLVRQAQLIHERDLLKELSDLQENADAAISRSGPNASGLLSVSPQVIAGHRELLPLIYDETNALARMFENSRAAVDAMAMNELPARRQIEIQMDRQVAAAEREIIAYRQMALEKKITMAELEAAEEQYTAVVDSLAAQRAASLRLQKIEQIKMVEAAGVGLLQALGFRKAAAIVETAWEAAQSIAAFARYDFWSGTQHALASAAYAVVAGKSGAASASIGAGGGASPYTIVGPGGATGGTIIGPQTAAPQLASGAAGAHAARESGATVIVVTEAQVLRGAQVGPALAAHLNSYVVERDGELLSSRSISSTTAAR